MIIFCPNGDRWRDYIIEKEKMEKEKTNEELMKDKDVMLAVETLKKKGFTPEEYEKALKDNE